jgi:hypothetical protein
MNIPESSNRLLHYYSVPVGFRDWCRDQQIQGHLFERFDGGGSTGITIEFTDAVAKVRAEERFPGWHDTYFLSDFVLYREPL